MPHRGATATSLFGRSRKSCTSSYLAAYECAMTLGFISYTQETSRRRSLGLPLGNLLVLLVCCSSVGGLGLEGCSAELVPEASVASVVLAEQNGGCQDRCRHKTQYSSALPACGKGRGGRCTLSQHGYGLRMRMLMRMRMMMMLMRRRRMIIFAGAVLGQFRIHLS